MKTSVKALLICIFGIIIVGSFLGLLFNLDIIYKQPLQVEYSINNVSPIVEKQEATIFQKDWESEIIKISSYRTSASDAKEIYNSVINYGYDNLIDYRVILGMIAQESKFLKNAKSYLGAKYGRGLMQVSEVALTDYNKWNGCDYTTNDLYNIDINIKIGCWTLKQQEYYLRKYDDITLSDMVIAFNVGCGDFSRNKEDLRNGTFKGREYNYLNNVVEYVKRF